MTGQIAFARTIRALDADDFRAPKLGLFFAIILLALWTWWFFAASIPQHETGINLELNQNTAIADFPPTTQIHPGQPAQIIMNDGQLINAQVEKVTTEPTTVRIQFNLSPTTPATSHQPPATARATIEVNRATPASLVLHALRR
ncbi:MAG TPA: hypothetical protein VGP62_06590 [Bryobacteraceae bacterium]|jgi:hypothetical protein|nr:hypothetical protein [Bryobacteraceae bacterium]